MISCKLREVMEKWVVSHTAGSLKKCYNLSEDNYTICNIFHQKCLYSLTQPFYL